MNIIIDVGNTTTNIALFNEDIIIISYSILTPKNSDFSEFEKEIYDKFSTYQFNDIYVSSVVPSVSNTLNDLFIKLFNKNIITMNISHIKNMKFLVDDPLEIGSDLIAASIRAVKKYGYPIIISDLGTANKVIAIDKDGNFKGVVIFPGMLIGYQAMIGSAEKLPPSILKKTTKIIGTNTIDCMNSGTINSVYYSVKGFMDDFEKELGYTAKKILTGGYSRFILDKFENVIYDENLTIEGVYEAYKQYKKGN